MKALLECGVEAHFLLLAGDDHFSMINRLSEEGYFLTKVQSAVCVVCVCVCVHVRARVCVYIFTSMVFFFPLQTLIAFLKTVLVEKSSD